MFIPHSIRAAAPALWVGALLASAGWAGAAGVGCAPALAYETDQITDRLAGLRDSSALADAKADQVLRGAAERTNEQTACKLSLEVTRRILAENIYDRTAFPTYVKGRTELAGLGYGAYAAWLENDPRVARRTVGITRNIYGGLRPRQALILATVGVCSTVRLASVLMGTDKPDHFWAQGYEYFLTSHAGHADDAAIRWGVTSERGEYGLATSGVFSYADLAANWAGYQFYKALLTERSPLQRGSDGCVVQRKAFHWAEWINDAVDEALNPPIYRPAIASAVRSGLAAERDTVCSAYAVWGPATAARRAQIPAEQQAVLSPNAPPRVDEWQLDRLCGTGSPAGAQGPAASTNTAESTVSSAIGTVIVAGSSAEIVP